MTQTPADDPGTERTADQSRLQVICSRHFVRWLTDRRISLAFTTYQANKVFFVGTKPDGQLSVFERTFNRCMGLWTDGQTIWMCSRFQLWRFENVLDAARKVDDYDRLYVPRTGYTTGDIDAHDVAIDSDDRVVFVNTRFSCLATIDDRYSFTPLWRPPFVSKLAAEDRCHLNGLAMHDGRPRYVTACAQSDVVDGWRDHRDDGGCVIDVESNQVVADGLSMPHSPRVHADKLWVLDSGTGFLGSVDRATGKFEPLTFCPGYARGLAFVANDAIVGLSKPRREQTFTGLALDQALAERNAVARCGLQVVDLASGDVLHWLRIEGVVEELYDVVVLPGVTRPKALGFKTDEIADNVWFEENGTATLWSAMSRD